MSSAEITKVVIAVEIEGAPYFVNLPLDLDALRRQADEWSVDLQARLMAAAKDHDDDGASNLMGEAACALKMRGIEADTLRARNAELEWLADDLADKVKGLESQLKCAAEIVAKRRGEDV